MGSQGTGRAVIVGAGPAGLIAAERLAMAGVAVTVYERMPNPARKFLLAGRGGLNLTHSEQFDDLTHRYGVARGYLLPALTAFPPQALIDWCRGLGQETFIGSSRRVFPKAMKATPLLRAWLARLDALGVEIRLRQRWLGWDEAGFLLMEGPEGVSRIETDAVLLALGGASWPRMGSDGGWVSVFERAGIAVNPLKPSNMGVTLSWPQSFLARYEGQPLKPVVFTFQGRSARGEAVITHNGLEGGAIYALSSPLRDAVECDGIAILSADLAPDMPLECLVSRLAAGRAKDSLSSRLRRLGLSAPASGLLRASGDVPKEPVALAARIKALPLTVTGTSGLSRAISSAGGVTFDEIDDGFMLKKRPGCFVAGEMLDWDAPTGGYLLQSCFSTGVAAAEGMLRHIDGERRS